MSASVGLKSLSSKNPLYLTNKTQPEAGWWLFEGERDGDLELEREGEREGGCEGVGEGEGERLLCGDFEGDGEGGKQFELIVVSMNPPSNAPMVVGAPQMKFCWLPTRLVFTTFTTGLFWPTTWVSIPTKLKVIWELMREVVPPIARTACC